MGIEVHGEVGFTVDDGSGPVAGRLLGEGRRLRVVADDPVAVWKGSPGGGAAPPSPRGLVAVAAGLLAGEGLTVELAGPRGTVATAGAGVRSRLGRLVAGSAQVRLGRPAALLPLARAQAGAYGRTPAVRGVLAAAVAVALVSVALRRARQ